MTFASVKRKQEFLLGKAVVIIKSLTRCKQNYMHQALVVVLTLIINITLTVNITAIVGTHRGSQAYNAL